MSRSTRRRAVLYVRISKDRADETSTITQLAALRAYCAAYDIEIVDEFVERGRSAYKGTKRPQLEAARAAVRNGSADTLIVWQLDRLARSVVELLQIVAELDKLDASLVMTQQQIDTSGPMGQMMLTILGALAQMESAIKGERMLSAAQYRRETGKPSRTRYFGYKTNDDGQLVEVDVEADGVRTAFAMFDAGESKAAIARELNAQGLRTLRGNDFSVVAVRDVLANPVYIAQRYAERWDRDADLDAMRNRDRIAGDWEPIVERDLFDRVGSLLDSGRGSIAAREPGLLSSIATCGDCGSTLIAHHHARGRRYSCSSSSCFKSCDEAALDELVLRLLVQQIDDATWSDLRVTRNSGDAVAAIEAQLEQLAIRYADDELTDVEWNAMRPRLAARLEAAEQRAADVVVPDIEYPFERWEQLTIEQQRAVIVAVVSSIVVQPAASTRQPLDDRVDVVPAV